MSKIQLSRQLSMMLSSLVKSFLIVYRMYSPWVKAILVMLLAYLAFKMGRKSVADRREQDVKRIEIVLKQRHFYSIQLPQRLTKIITTKKIVIIVIVTVVILLALKTLKLKARWLKLLTVTFTLQMLVLFCLLLIAIWSYELWLAWSIKKGTNTSMHINEELFTLMKQLGAKAQATLRLNLCKDKLISRKKRPAGVCFKQDCKQIRQYFRVKEEIIQRLVMHGLTFEWCSTCLHRKQFQEYLPFEPLLYLQDPDLPQQEEVSSKNNYLISQILRMCNWIRSLGPCNCSKLFWQSELKQVRHYKQGERQIEQKFRILKMKKGI